MKKLIIVISICTLSLFSFGQITTTKVEKKAEEVNNTPYDSTENFRGKYIHKYIGQELYVLGVS